MEIIGDIHPRLSTPEVSTFTSPIPMDQNDSAKHRKLMAFF
jgi:hypothetical protein